MKPDDLLLISIFHLPGTQKANRQSASIWNPWEVRMSNFKSGVFVVILEWRNFNPDSQEAAEDESY